MGAASTSMLTAHRRRVSVKSEMTDGHAQADCRPDDQAEDFAAHNKTAGAVPNPRLASTAQLLYLRRPGEP